MLYYISDSELAVSELNNFLSLMLPPYAIPTVYVHLKEFPLTVNGKIDKVRLPSINNYLTKYDDVDDSNDIFKSVTSIWKEVLNISNIQDNRQFFELGGSSIKALIMTKKINSKFRRKNKKNLMSIVDVFRYPTLKEQVKTITDRINKE